MKYFTNNKQRYSYAFTFSVALHALLVFVLFKSTIVKNYNELIANQSDVSSRKTIPLNLDSVKIISKKQLAQIKQNMRQQIVANELNGKKEKPAASRFMGEADQTFDRQTMARSIGAFKEAGLGSKTAESSKLSERSKEVAEKVKPAQTKALDFSMLGYKLAKHSEEEVKAVENSLNDQKNLGLEKGKAGVQGLASNSDFVEDVALGDMTNLNTTEFKYYGFYHRIRQKLEQYWGSNIQSKAKNLYKSGRRLPASENLITAIQVTLDDKGSIVDIKIEGTSGIRELDQAAIESFNKAGPFPNPPKGLLVGGRAVIQWGFVVKS